MSSSSQDHSMRWDTELNEPFIPVREGVRITPFHSDDTDPLFGLRTDAEVVAASNVDISQYTREKCHNYMQRNMATSTDLIDSLRRGEEIEASPFHAIRAHPSKALIGSIHIYSEETDTDKTDESAQPESSDSINGTREYEVGFSVSSAARGTGLAQAALSALIEGVVVGLLNGTSVIADVKEDNIASRKTLERCGFDEVRAYRPEELPPPFEKYTILLYRKTLSAPPPKVNIPSSSPRLSKVLWDTETKEPYIEVREGVRLTPVRPGDVDAWYELYNAPDVVRNAYLRKKPYTRETAQSRVDAAIQEQEPVISKLRDGVDAMSESPLTVIRAYPSGDLMGGIDVYPSDDHPLPESSDQRSEYSWVNQTWDIGYNLRPAYTGKGNMKATVEALIEGYVVPVMRIKRLGAEVRHDHSASLAILRSHGFEEVYRFEQDTAPESGVKPFTSIKLQGLF